MCLLKKNAQSKTWELCLIHWTFLGLQTWKTPSQLILRDCSGEAREEGGIYTSFCNKNWPSSQNIKGLLLIKENQISQVKKFLYMWRWWSWALWNHSFDMHPSYLGPVSCVFSSRVSSRYTIQAAIKQCGLMAARSFVCWCDRL